MKKNHSTGNIARKFCTLLIKDSWNRVVRTVCDVSKWLLFFQVIAYNAVYVSIMCGILYLIFTADPERSASLLTEPLWLVSVILRSMFALSIVSLFVLGGEEAVVRVYFSKNNPNLYETMFAAQKEMQNILMGLLSILALVAAVINDISYQLNLSLLFVGIVLFSYILVTTLYEHLFLKDHVVEKILEKIANEEK